MRGHAGCLQKSETIRQAFGWAGKKLLWKWFKNQERTGTKEQNYQDLRRSPEECDANGIRNRKSCEGKRKNGRTDEENDGEGLSEMIRRKAV